MQPSSIPPMRTQEDLVLLPGTLCDERVFEPLLGRVSPAQVLIPRLVGHESSREMARALLDRLPERFALAGFSLGGIVALEIVRLSPERVTRLALIDTTARPDSKTNWAARRNAVERAAKVGVDRYVSDKLWSVYVSSEAAANDELRALVRAMSAAVGLDAFRQQSEIAISRADSRPRLCEIAVPTLILCGADDQLCSVEVHREMAALIPGSRLAIVPGAGHFALVEQPDVVAREVDAWLQVPAQSRPIASEKSR